jgi:serine protease inhibitor
MGSPHTSDEINKYISERTRGRIRNVVKEISPSILAIIINTLYIKKEWETKFMESLTKPHPFHTSDGSIIMSPFMKIMKRMKYEGTSSLHTIQLNLKSNYSLIIEMPESLGGFRMNTSRVLEFASRSMFSEDIASTVKGEERVVT